MSDFYSNTRQFSYSDDFYKRMRAEQQDATDIEYANILNRNRSKQIAAGKTFYEKPDTMVWIEGFEELYAINKDGDIWSAASGEFLHHSRDTSGYLFVTMYKEGKRNIRRVHLLVAQTFLPKPPELLDYKGRIVVDHVDGDKTHCSVDNLEWVTQAINTKRAYENGLAASATARAVMCVENGQRYKSATSAAEANGVSRSAISKAAANGTKAAGHHWKFVD